MVFDLPLSAPRRRVEDEIPEIHLPGHTAAAELRDGILRRRGRCRGDRLDQRDGHQSCRGEDLLSHVSTLYRCGFRIAPPLRPGKGAIRLSPPLPKAMAARTKTAFG